MTSTTDLTIDTRQVVSDYLSRVGSGDVDGALELIAEPVDWFTPGSVELIPWMGARHNRAEVRTFFLEAGRNLSLNEFAVHNILVDGNIAVVLGEFDYTVGATSRSFRSEFALELEVRAGRITRYHMHEDSYAISLAF